MHIQGSVALVTGTHRGIGRHFVTALIDQGAAKVYATARDLHGITDLVTRHPGKVEAMPLDVTNAAQVMAAAHTCADVTLLINNAGVNYNTGLLAAPTVDAARHEGDPCGLARTSQRFDGLQRGVGEHGVHLGHYWREGTA